MKTEIEIRSYKPADMEAVICLWQECGLVAPQNDPVKDIEMKLRVNPEWFLVGTLAGKIIATCMVGYEGHRGWINYLAVSPNSQRLGIARKIMARAEAVLRDFGCAKINLQVRTSNTGVVDFYRAIGFELDNVVSLGKRLS